MKEIIYIDNKSSPPSSGCKHTDLNSLIPHVHNTSRHYKTFSRFLADHCLHLISPWGDDRMAKISWIVIRLTSGAQTETTILDLWQTWQIHGEVTYNSQIMSPEITLTTGQTTANDSQHALSQLLTHLSPGIRSHLNQEIHRAQIL